MHAAGPLKRCGAPLLSHVPVFWLISKKPIPFANFTPTTVAPSLPPSFCFSPVVARSWHRVGGFISGRENAYSLSLSLSFSRSVPWSPRSSCLFWRFPRQRFLDSDFSTPVMVVRGLLRRFFPSTSGGFMRRQEGRLGETCTRFENRAPDNSRLICRYISRRRLCCLRLPLYRVIEGYLMGSRCNLVV